MTATELDTVECSAPESGNIASLSAGALDIDYVIGDGGIIPDITVDPADSSDSSFSL
jgi:hypothetical protein